MIIRAETETAPEQAALAALVTRAFATAQVASGTEAEVLARLRESGALSLSLVAEEAGQLVGQIAASPATIGGAEGWACLGPLSVVPEAQGRGIGSALMRAALAQLAARGAAGAVLVGEPAYYGRFGFVADPAVVLAGVPARYVLVRPLAGPTPAGALVCAPALMP
ncbi:N-acetyltransferase [Sinirhodobacter ferrireducens]|uniref:N-acetyltransferase n=1 Tax=Paenirhodobacter ferrireducens TaxID=1215032 RepID=A0A443LAD1_9RHOB|nr:N-acetyltransferase [Sinirhodobacter ferrireducens]RWR46103.1 N-acetyltransferase [Sinirhodobacter ferrireducens]